MAKEVGQKRAREIIFLAEEYSAQDAYDWGAVNRVVDHERIEHEALAMAATIATKSPQAVRMLKFAFNLADDGLMGQQVFAGERSEEHTSELQSRGHHVCRLLLEKKKISYNNTK